MHKRKLFFDLDNTLTRSRSPIEKKMKNLLEKIPLEIIIISGASKEQIQKQIQDLFPCYILGQNGNDALYKNEKGEEMSLWKETLNKEERDAILKHINSLTLPHNVPDKNDLIEERGSQISFSIYGHHAPIEIKEKIDPTHALRKKILKEHPLISNTIEVKIAGTTTLDYFKKGRNKGYNIQKLLDYKKWEKEDCLYFGDALFKGGNDETVIGVIETVSVENPEETYTKIEKYAKKTF
jgi:phosphomannomutase